MNVNTELKAAESLLSKLNKKYSKEPHQTLGTAIIDMELLIMRLKELNQ